VTHEVPQQQGADMPSALRAEGVTELVNRQGLCVAEATGIAGKEPIHHGIAQAALPGREQRPCLGASSLAQHPTDEPEVSSAR